MGGMILQKYAPSYPKDAKEAGVQGTVVIAAEIDTTGHISDLKVVSGPLMLRQAALDAVRKWVYRPYFFNGNPVPVRTQMNVIFSLGQ